jgi:sulfoxide reductase heme-binding subunit YedZ
MGMKTEKHDWHSIALFVLGSLIGGLLGLWVMRGVVSAMDAKSPGFWFVSRAAGLVGYLLLWASAAWGILISSKAVKELVPGPLAFTLHNVTAWLALGFGAVHALALLGDRVVSFNLVAILLPFAAGYQPVLTGLGTLSLYAGLLVSLSFYFTKQIGHRTWRLIHMLSYLMFVGVTIHGVLLGTDSSTLVMRVAYLLAGGSVLFLTLFRILTVATGSAAPNRIGARRQRRSGSPG